MRTVRHIARATGSTSSAAPAYRVELRAGSHHLVADETVPIGGANAGPSPFGLLVSALAACTAMTLRMYAHRKGWELGAIDVDVRYDLDDEERSSIQRTISLPADLPEDQRLRLADVAERTPVTNAVRVGTPITTTIRSTDG